MEGHFKHKIGDEEVHFFIGNYALERSLEDMDASLSDLAELLNKKFMATLRLFMYHSAEYQAYLDQKDFPFKPMDVHKWIDKTGGVEGKFYKDFSFAMIKALGLIASEPEDEKKSPIQKKK